MIFFSNVFFPLPSTKPGTTVEFQVNTAATSNSRVPVCTGDTQLNFLSRPPWSTQPMKTELCQIGQMRITLLNVGEIFFSGFSSIIVIFFSLQWNLGTVTFAFLLVFLFCCLLGRMCYWSQRKTGMFFQYAVSCYGFNAKLINPAR